MKHPQTPNQQFNGSLHTTEPLLEVLPLVFVAAAVIAIAVRIVLKRWPHLGATWSQRLHSAPSHAAKEAAKRGQR